MSTAVLLSAEKQTFTSKKPKRFHELDSMRGIAAIIVVFGHYLDMFWMHLDKSAGFWRPLLYVGLSGHESVMYFFVLSGFVLSLPYLSGKAQPYPLFLWRRTLRIYGPYIGSLMLALIGCALWGGRTITTGWRPETWSSITLPTVIQHILLLGNYDYGRYNVVIWSLVYEMRISIIFPFVFFLTNKLKLSHTLLIMAFLLLIGVRGEGHPYLITCEYIAVFMVGILLAKHLAGISPFYKELSLPGKLFWVVATVFFYFLGHRIILIGPLWHLGDMPIVIGSAGFIIIGLNSLTAQRALLSRVPLFLGRVSYSLYLVHGVVLFAMASILRDKIGHIAFLFLFLSIAIFLSWLFYLGVEKPFTNMSRNVGRPRKASLLPS
jgi:peptidoglycan/LPS O-acetylase OafA/YrhL